MKVIRITFFTAIVLATCLLSAQGQPYTFSLIQARDYALEYNKRLLNARDEVNAANEKLRASIALGLPQIDGGFDYTTYFNYEMEFNFGGSGSSDINYSVLDSGDYEILGAMSGSADPIVMNDKLTGNVGISQLIFSGQFMAGVQTMKIYRKLVNQKVMASEQDVIENITNSYNLILTTEKNLDIVKENLTNMNEMVQHANNKYKAGIGEETDVDQLRITVSQLKNIQNSLERTVQLNYNLLKYQLGVGPEAEIILTDSIEQVMLNINPQKVFIEKWDVANNINYQMTESQVMMSKKQVDLQKWTYAPTISGYYNYTEKIVSTGFDLSPNSMAGVGMSVPIFSSGMRKAKVSEAKINLNIAERNLEMTKEQLQTQENQLLFNYQNALENFNTQKENVDVAKRMLKSIQNKYQQGLVSSMDLTQANSGYLSAESNYTSSILVLLQAQTSLEKLYNLF